MNIENQTAIINLLLTISRNIPATLTGLERQRYIGERIIERLIEEDREILLHFVDELLLQLHLARASDIDFGGLGCGGRVWARIMGQKKPLDGLSEMSADDFSILIQNMLTEGQREHLFAKRNLDFSHNLIDTAGTLHRFRADSYFEMDTLAVNFRAIDSKIRSLESYLFSPYVQRLLSLSHTKEGLVLVTGITGSGKSSTLDAIIDYNNENIDGHIIVVASPIEFIHSSKRCLVRHREVGRDTLSFKIGTIEALRQDPDIIVVGEMRDPETIDTALEAADSGHKVLSTLHTSSCTESIERIIGEIPPSEQDRIRMRLASVLRCVISQKLVPTLTGELTLAREILVMLPSVQAAIRNNNIEEIYQMISEGAKYGMITMEQNLKYLYSIKKISLQTAENYANNKRMIQQLLQAA